MTVVNGYCTTAQVQAVLGLGTSDDTTLIENAVNAASRQIDAETGWRFWQDATVKDRLFYPDNARFLYVCDDDADGAGISTTSGLIVKLDTADDRSFVSTLTINTDFTLRPANAGARVPVWPYTDVILTGQSFWFNRSWYNRPTVQITAKWGWPAVPDDIAEACIIQSAQVYKSKDAVFGAIALGGEAGVAMRLKATMHPQAAGLVAAYSKPRFG